MHSPSEELKSTVGRALGKVPSGLFILTAGPVGKQHAALVSWVQQTSFHPPAVSVAIGKERPVNATIRAEKKFALSIIPQGDSTLMKKYARGIPEGADPFEGVTTQSTSAGQTILSDGLGYLDCRLLDVCNFGGDHELFIGEVTGGEIFRDGPAFAHQRGNGFHY